MGDFRDSPLAARIRAAMPIVTEILLQRCKDFRFSLKPPFEEITTDEREPDTDALLAAGLCMYGTGNHYGLPMPMDDPNRRECLIRAGALIVSQIQRMDREAAELAADTNEKADNSLGGLLEDLEGGRNHEADRAAIDHTVRNEDMRAGALSYCESRMEDRLVPRYVPTREHTQDTPVAVRVTFGPLVLPDDFEIGEPIE